jgi:hypothetical protein
MKTLSFAWSPALVALIACGGRAAQPADTSGGAGSGGNGPVQQAAAGQDGIGGSGGSATDAGKSGGGSGAVAGSANAGNSGSTGTSASGSAGNGGGSAGVGGQSGVDMTPEALVPIANAFCAAARSCCKNDSTNHVLDDCESRYALSPTPRGLVSGTITIDSAGLPGCLAEYQAAAETCKARGVLAACRGLVHGLLTEGQSCRFDSECSGVEAVCLLPKENTAGVCKKVAHGQAGDACVIDCPPDGNCAQIPYATADASPTGCFAADGTYCERWSNSPHCQLIRAAGAACTDSEQCGSTAAECDVQTGKCKALPCIADGTCQDWPFTAGGTCAGSSYGP